MSSAESLSFDPSRVQNTVPIHIVIPIETVVPDVAPVSLIERRAHTAAQRIIEEGMARKKELETANTLAPVANTTFVDRLGFRVLETDRAQRDQELAAYESLMAALLEKALK